MKIWLTLIFCWGVCYSSLSAQIFGDPERENRVWNIRFILDFNPELGTIGATYRDFYEGERYIFPTDSTPATWEWTTWDTTDMRVLDFYKIGNVRLGVMLNLYENLYIGVNYTNYIVQGFPRATQQAIGPGLNLPPYVYWPFFALSGAVSYDVEMPFLTGLSLQPTFSLGTYQSDRFFEGVGREIAWEGRLAFTYQLRQDRPLRLRLWAGYQDLSYRANSVSFVFPERQRRLETDWTMFNIGAGLSWNLTIQEDPPEDQTAKQRRVDRKRQRLEKKQAKLERKLGED